MLYGSHDPATAPTTVEVKLGTRYRFRDVVAPIPPALVAQRRRLNERAAHTVRPGCAGPCKRCEGEGS
jgi:hypothetical protein